MNNIAVQAEDIGKLYRLGENSAYNTIRDAFSAAASGTLRRILSREQTHAPANQEGLWALKDVSFDVKVGDIVGLIGGTEQVRARFLRFSRASRNRPGAGRKSEGELVHYWKSEPDFTRNLQVEKTFFCPAQF